MIKKSILLLLSIVVFIFTSFSIDVISTNNLRSIRSGYLNSYSQDSSIINPASLTFLNKNLFFSFYNTKYNYNFYSIDTDPEKHLLMVYQPLEINAGFQFAIQHFDSKVGYTESSFSTAYSQKFFNKLSLGLRANFSSYEMEIWDNYIGDNIVNSESSILFDFCIIFNPMTNLYLSSSVKSINDSKNISFDNGVTYDSRYGNFMLNYYTYKNGLQETKTNFYLGYEKSFFNNLLIPSVGLNVNKTINAGLSVNYRFLSFDFGYEHEFQNNFYDKLSFGLSIKLNYDWYAEKRDVLIFDSNTNFFHFIIITNEELKVKDKWIKVTAKEANNPGEFRNLNIKTNIGDSEIKNAYIYIKIPIEWIANQKINKEKIKVDILTNNKRKTLPLFYLYEDSRYYYYMSISEIL